MEPERDGDALYRRHARPLWALLYARGGDAELARDAVQEAFLRLAAQREPIAQPRGWLFRVGLNWQRDQQRRVRRSVPAEDAALPAAGDDPLATAVAQETQAQVRTALAGLPVADREALALRYGLQWSSARIAETLGTTPAAVDMRLSRARAKLAAALAEMGLGDDAG